MSAESGGAMSPSEFEAALALATAGQFLACSGAHADSGVAM
ncbi:hypothetical protein [Cryobacterium sp. GrIS_2_6]|nr:hypothetical protein [Cryobacterium psychrotolerans]